MKFSSQTLVLGIGNSLHSDDGVGMHAAQLLQRDWRLPPGTVVIEGGTLGLELLPYLQDARHILILDAIDTGDESGKIVRMVEDDLHRLKGSSNAHQLGVADLLMALRLVQNREPEITILGIQPGSTEWGTDLTPAVSAALPDLLDLALSELRDWCPVSPG